MRNKILIGLAIFVVVAGVALFFLKKYTKSHSPEAVAFYNQNGLEIHINYCQPSKKGRVIFGTEAEKALQPYGKYWRLGANEATTFETNHDLLINGSELKSGKYQIYTIPGKDSWQICFNSDWDRWGAQEANHETDVLKTEVACINNASANEKLALGFDAPDASGASNLTIHWDKTMVKVPFISK